MNVELVDYQKNALAILLYTKNTRLRSEFPDLASIEAQPEEWKLDQLAYMKDTIKSSWEFATYTFNITGVTRAFTHQLVRTRTASYAQEAQRVADLSEFDYLMPRAIEEMDSAEATAEYKDAMYDAGLSYSRLEEMGVPRQDARGVIPTNVLTNIMMACNLRILHTMAELRLCFRVQDEYQSVFKLMKQRVVEVQPWAEPFIQVFCANHGTCAFPRYTECPIQKHTYTANASHNSVLDNIRQQHTATAHEAQPVVTDGKTM